MIKLRKFLAKDWDDSIITTLKTIFTHGGNVVNKLDWTLKDHFNLVNKIITSGDINFIQKHYEIFYSFKIEEQKD